MLDGTTGLNMLNQAEEFNKMVDVTGIILTKLDGTSKGGAVVSVVDELGVPPSLWAWARPWTTCRRSTR